MPMPYRLRMSKATRLVSGRDLFQFRATDYKGGERLTYNEKRAGEIVKKWDSEKLDPIIGGGRSRR